MARRLRKFLKDKKGSAAVEFIGSVTVLILIFATLLLSFVYIAQYYNASYICRRVTRSIEIDGYYSASEVNELAERMGGDSLDGLSITVTPLAPYFADTKIQLKDEFEVRLSASYRIPVSNFNDSVYYITLPINVGIRGRSEVYWK